MKEGIRIIRRADRFAEKVERAPKILPDSGVEPNTELRSLRAVKQWILELRQKKSEQWLATQALRSSITSGV
ncbi:MAG TPA: hypothetical protein VGQ41_09290 [Pyrinomonadaceae bacterium]|jgi:hypothetical protein|nr:hypothetical protein [Pyrinomonadaceae bacterium]